MENRWEQSIDRFASSTKPEILLGIRSNKAWEKENQDAELDSGFIRTHDRGFLNFSFWLIEVWDALSIHRNDIFLDLAGTVDAMVLDRRFVR
jgi:hypothetical protein